jgi:ribosomal protein L12E/L44/L45/RPP1/RPP2
MANWYYVKNDQQCGPVPREKLQQLLAAGEIGRQDLVWTQTMAEWSPAGNVPGLIPAGAAAWPAATAAAKPAPAAGALLEATPARAETEYREEPSRGVGGAWANLSPGMKTGIMVGAGGAMLVFLLAIVMIVNSPGDDEQPSVDQPQAAKQESVKQEPVKEETPNTAVLQLYDFDPKSLTTASDKAAYELGMKQGGSIIARDYAEVIKTNPHPTQDQLRTHVKKWMQERDVAIHMGVVGHGRESEDVITLFGRRDGMKAWLKEHGLPQP